MKWREWVDRIEKRWGEGYIDTNEVTELIKGLRLCAEAVVTFTAIEECPDHDVMRKLTLAQRAVVAQEAALEFLRGVGRD